MKIILLYFFIFKLIIPIKSIIPLWNFTNSTVDLLKNSNIHQYNIFEKDLGSNNYISLVKTISIKERLISEKNMLYINSSDYSFNQEVAWDNIKNSFIKDNKIYICPKGRYHVQKYQKNNGLIPLIPSSLESDDVDWDLQCSKNRIESTDYLFVVYSNMNQLLYFYLLDSSSWKSAYIGSILYDYKWTGMQDTDSAYKMALIKLSDNYISLVQSKIKFEDNI